MRGQRRSRRKAMIGDIGVVFWVNYVAKLT